MNMNNRGLLLLHLLIMSWSCGLAKNGSCWEGHRLHNSADPNTGKICLLCEEGTYMAEKEHWNEKCNKCSEKISDLEVVVRACNITHDTEIQCVSGYNRRRAQTALEKDACVKCRRRESGFPARPCQGYNDTVCCPLMHDAVWTCEGKYECQERPVCGAGMYYNTSVGVCLSCPNGTYMQLNTHSAMECVKCEVLSANRSNNAAILHKCTRTSPTIFGCKDFHFRASDSGSLLKEAPCKPCQRCSRYLEHCHIFHDTVCAKGSDVDDTSKGDTDQAEDTEKRPRGPSVTTDTRHSHERNESNRAQNGVAEYQTSLPSYVFEDFAVYSVLIAILITIICIYILNTIHCRRGDVRRRFKAPIIVLAVIAFVLLLVVLIIRTLLTTGWIETSHGFGSASVIIGLLLFSYVIYALFCIKRPTIHTLIDSSSSWVSNRAEDENLLQ